MNLGGTSDEKISELILFFSRFALILKVKTTKKNTNGFL